LPTIIEPVTGIEIGTRLRQARQERGLTIDQLAQATGLTKGFLSQVERDLASTSVSSLLKICSVLGLRVGELFDEPESGLVRAAERPLLDFGGFGAEDRLLTPRSNRRLQAFHSTVGPGARSGDGPGYPTPTEAQFVHVTKGEFEITLGDEVFRLRAGDSLTFGGREPRSWRNPSRSRGAELIWVLTPSLFQL
jgi:transcriptional regulator with XRE-family HTH domain